MRSFSGLDSSSSGDAVPVRVELLDQFYGFFAPSRLRVITRSREDAKSAVKCTDALGTYRQTTIGIAGLVLSFAETAAVVATVVGRCWHTTAAAAIDRQTGTVALQRSSSREAAAARSC
jgi:hypothetical protein